MRRQDELLLLYPGQSHPVRRFTLTQLEDFALAFDAEEILDFLRTEAKDPDPAIAHPALAALGVFLAGYIHKRYAFTSLAKGAWTGYGADATEIKLILDENRSTEDLIDQRKSSALVAMRPLIVPLARNAAADGPTTTSALMALAHLPTSESRLVLTRLGAEVAFRAVLARAIASEGLHDQDELERLIRTGLVADPDLALVVGALQPERALGIIIDLADKVDAVGRINLATALARLRDVDRSEAMTALVARKEGWVMVQVLAAIEREGVGADLPLVREIYTQTGNEFVRTQALRAAGSLSGPESVKFCLKALADGGALTSAQAMESLVRLQCPPEALRRVAATQLSSPHLKTRVNALMAIWEPTEGELPVALRELLLASDPISRLEATYCLGYLQSESALRALTILAGHDPNLTVRLQAVKSLSKYRAVQSVGPLLDLLEDRDADVAIAVARTLTRFTGSDAKKAALAVEEALGRAKSSLARALLLRTYGGLGRRGQTEGVLGPLIQGLRSERSAEVAGALEGWIAYGLASSDELVECLDKRATSGEPRLRARAILGLVAAGFPQRVETLGPLILSEDPAVASSAVEASLELALLVGRVRLDGRLPLMEAALDGHPAPGDHHVPGVRGPASIDLRSTAASTSGIATRSAPVEELQSMEFQIRRVVPGDVESGKPSAQRTSGVRDRSSGLVRAASPASKSGGRAIPTAQLASDDLLAHLKRADVREASSNESTVRGLRKVTYLVSDKVSEPTVLDRLRPWAPLVVPVIILVALAGAVRTRMRTVETTLISALPEADLCLKYAAGEVTFTPATRKTPGTILAQGLQVVCGATGSVRLATRTGGTIGVGPGGSLVVDELEERGKRLRLKVTPCVLGVDLRKGGVVEVVLGPYAVRTTDGAFRIETAGGMRLVADFGVVDVLLRGTPHGTATGGKPFAFDEKTARE